MNGYDDLNGVIICQKETPFPCDHVSKPQNPPAHNTLQNTPPQGKSIWPYIIYQYIYFRALENQIQKLNNELADTAQACLAMRKQLPSSTTQQLERPSSPAQVLSTQPAAVAKV